MFCVGPPAPMSTSCCQGADFQSAFLGHAMAAGADDDDILRHLVANVSGNRRNWFALPVLKTSLAQPTCSIQYGRRKRSIPKQPVPHGNRGRPHKTPIRWTRTRD